MQQNGIIPGIKVDTGTHPLAGFSGEVVTEALHGLRDRLQEYYALGARFAKWRAVITIGEDMPSGTRSDARRVGKERVRTCSSRWYPHHDKKTSTTPQHHH